ncbi:MAG: hypothetical protein ACRD72_19875 [Candidatus Angelobacter sp.]
MTVTQLASFDPSTGPSSFNTQQKTYKLLVYNWSQYSLVFTATSGNAYLIPAKTRRRVYLDELDGKIAWVATSVLSTGVNLVQMEIFLDGDCLPYDDLEDLSSAGPPATNFWQGDGAPDLMQCSSGAIEILTLGINTPGGTATINVNGDVIVRVGSVAHQLWVVVDGDPTPPTFQSNFPNAGGSTSSQFVTTLTAGYHTILFQYFTQSIGLFGCDDLAVSHIDVTVV